MKKKYFNGSNNFQTININFWLITSIHHSPRAAE